jgi:hypothetical protein
MVGVGAPWELMGAHRRGEGEGEGEEGQWGGLGGAARGAPMEGGARPMRCCVQRAVRREEKKRKKRKGRKRRRKKKKNGKFSKNKR